MTVTPRKFDREEGPPREHRTKRNKPCPQDISERPSQYGSEHEAEHRSSYSDIRQWHCQPSTRCDCVGADSNICVGKASTANFVHLLSRGKVGLVERLTVDPGPVREHVHGSLQTLIAGKPTRTEGATQRHKVDIVVVWGRCVGHSIDEAVILGVGVCEAGGTVHGFVRQQVLVRALHDRVVRSVIWPAIIVLEHRIG